MKYKHRRRYRKVLQVTFQDLKKLILLVVILIACVVLMSFQGIPIPSRDDGEILQPEVIDSSNGYATCILLLIVVTILLHKLMNLYFYRQEKPLPEKIDRTYTCKWIK